MRPAPLPESIAKGVSHARVHPGACRFFHRRADQQHQKGEVTMPVSEAKLRAIKKYQREKVRQKSVKFFPADADLFAWVEERGKVEGVNAYIKRLIREDMERGRAAK